MATANNVDLDRAHSKRAPKLFLLDKSPKSLEVTLPAQIGKKTRGK